jgi:ribosomal protein L4
VRHRHQPAAATKTSAFRRRVNRQPPPQNDHSGAARYEHAATPTAVRIGGSACGYQAEGLHLAASLNPDDRQPIRIIMQQ